MRSARNRAKYYTITKQFFREFEEGDKVFLKAAPNQYGLKFGKSKKISPRFCDSFEILKRIG